MTTIDINPSCIPDHVYARILAYGAKDIMYKAGMLEPRYPMPVTERDNILAMPYGHVMPIAKALVLP